MPTVSDKPGGPPTEIARADFEIAVFDNRFPALRPDPEEPSVGGSDLTPVEPSFGACEVVVYTPQHSGQLGSMTVEHVRRLVAVWGHRTLVLGARDEVAYVYAFENRGEQIGVTLNHPHGQIYAYPTIPPILERETANARSHRERTTRMPVVRPQAARSSPTADGSWRTAAAGSPRSRSSHAGRTRSTSRRSGTSDGSTSWTAARSTVSRACC